MVTRRSGCSALTSARNFSAASWSCQKPAATCAPWLASSWQMAAPMPRVPPVTNATRPSTSPGRVPRSCSSEVVIACFLSPAQQPAHDLAGPGLGHVVGADDSLGPGELSGALGHVPAERILGRGARRPSPRFPTLDHDL